MRLRTEVLDVARDEQGYTLQLNGETVSADNPGDRQRRPRCRGWALHRSAIKLPSSLA